MKSNVLRYRGSNFLRQRLVLSTVSGRPIVITDIRSQDEEPGLKDYEALRLRRSSQMVSASIDEEQCPQVSWKQLFAAAVGAFNCQWPTHCDHGHPLTG
mmetsp:Transcript_72335/g.172756  ORF Transcript_72335/g.172756 Transcript_72335/m.172756 type:complete len:99 (-) Transcript_72335:29-325(-)